MTELSPSLTISEASVDKSLATDLSYLETVISGKLLDFQFFDQKILLLNFFVGKKSKNYVYLRK